MEIILGRTVYGYNLEADSVEGENRHAGGRHRAIVRWEC